MVLCDVTKGPDTVPLPYFHLFTAATNELQEAIMEHVSKAKRCSLQLCPVFCNDSLKMWDVKKIEDLQKGKIRNFSASFFFSIQPLFHEVSAVEISVLFLKAEKSVKHFSSLTMTYEIHSVK